MPGNGNGQPQMIDDVSCLQDYTFYPAHVIEDIVRLRRRINDQVNGVPRKVTDRNLLIGTWNIRGFGRVFPSWDENPDSPKRNLRALSYIVEIIRRLDIVAIQEITRNLSGVRMLLDWLGPNWGLIYTDVTAGEKGNKERLGFIYDRRRVRHTGLAGEIVLPPRENDNLDPVTQLVRTPFAVGFEAGNIPFALVTAHIKYGRVPRKREAEICALAGYIAEELLARTKRAQESHPMRIDRCARHRLHKPPRRRRNEDSWKETCRSVMGIQGEAESNIIVLGDFNIDKRNDPRFKAFASYGLWVPPELINVKTTYGRVAKHYDQIAWFRGDLRMVYNERAGSIDFMDAVYKEASKRDVSFRISDHFPLWAEFRTDRSREKMACILGQNPDYEDALDVVPN